METLLNNIKLDAFGQTFNLSLIKGEYQNNKRLYLGLIDNDTGEFFCDITENHTEIRNLQEGLNNEHAERVILDNDFLAVFDNDTWKAHLWLKSQINSPTSHLARGIDLNVDGYRTGVLYFGLKTTNAK